MPFLLPKERVMLSAVFIITFLISAFLSALLIWPHVIVSKVTKEELPAPGKVEITQANAGGESSINIVFVGHGGAGHPGGNLADAIILVNIQPESKKVRLISIPRDLWVNLPSSENKINHAFAESPTALKDAVATVTGIRPEYYASIDFVAFQRAIGTLGSITVNVPADFDDYFYPIEGKELDLCGFSPEKMQEVHAQYSGFELEKQFTCRYEHISFRTGLTEMEGGDALKFVRSRHSATNGSDFARSQRQQAVLLGIRDRLLELDAWENIPEFFEELGRFIGTDVELSAALGMAELIIDPTTYEVDHVYLTTENVLKEGTSTSGAYILFPKAGLHEWSEVKNFIQQ